MSVFFSPSSWNKRNARDPSCCPRGRKLSLLLFAAPALSAFLEGQHPPLFRTTSTRTTSSTTPRLAPPRPYDDAATAQAEDENIPDVENDANSFDLSSDDGWRSEVLDDEPPRVIFINYYVDLVLLLPLVAALVSWEVFGKIVRAIGRSLGSRLGRFVPAGAVLEILVLEASMLAGQLSGCSNAPMLAGQLSGCSNKVKCFLWRKQESWYDLLCMSYCYVLQRHFRFMCLCLLCMRAVCPLCSGEMYRDFDLLSACWKKSIRKIMIPRVWKRRAFRRGFRGRGALPPPFFPQTRREQGESPPTTGRRRKLFLLKSLGASGASCPFAGNGLIRTPTNALHSRPCIVCPPAVTFFVGSMATKSPTTTRIKL